MKLDLHTHSHFSDGTLAPAGVVQRAFERGVGVMVLTDHDSVDGYPEAQAAGERLGLRVLCGVEINTREDDLHVLGYGIDWRSAALRASLVEFRGRREKRIRAVVERLREAQVDLRWEEVQGEAAVTRSQSVGRPHVADALRRKGLVRNRHEAFQKYLSPGRPGFVGPMGPTAEEAIAAIRAAGGMPVIAHPGSLFDLSDFQRWAEAGLLGIEVFYPTHSGGVVRELLGVAQAAGLTPTGGSDFHGPGTGRDKIAGFEPSDEVRKALAPRLGVELE
ncbi:MAG: PHP domain-containing protein [Elusimicrobia bacterium]|nr:PHP domain-containing protein [Elusimicrobiota bacterium]